MRVSMIVVVFFRVRTRRLRRIPPPPPPPSFPNSLSAPPVLRRLSGRRRSHRPRSMLLLLATHVDLELSFGSSSNQPLCYCSEKRSLHLQLEKRTLLFSLDRSASCDCWRSQGSTAAQPQRPMRAADAGDTLATESTGTILVPRQMSPIAGHEFQVRRVCCVAIGLAIQLFENPS